MSQGQCKQFNNLEKCSSLLSLNILPLPMGYKKNKEAAFHIDFLCSEQNSVFGLTSDTVRVPLQPVASLEAVSSPRVASEMGDTLGTRVNLLNIILQSAICCLSTLSFDIKRVWPLKYSFFSRELDSKTYIFFFLQCRISIKHCKGKIIFQIKNIPQQCSIEVEIAQGPSFSD